MLDHWNDALERMHPEIAKAGTQLQRYREAFTPADLPSIPPHDLPAGIPAWMRSPDPWAKRDGRRVLTVTIPASFPVG